MFQEHRIIECAVSVIAKPGKIPIKLRGTITNKIEQSRFINHSL